jgi:acetyl esterase/lipase
MTWAGGKSDQVGMLGGLSGAGHHVISFGCQQSHRHAAHSAGCPGDQHRALVRGQTVVFQAPKGQRCGETGCPDDGGTSGTEPMGQGHYPVGGHLGVLGEPSMMGHSEFVAVHDDRLTDFVLIGRNHGSHQIDAGHQGGDTSDPVTHLCDHASPPVFVIHRRPVDPDPYLPGREFVEGQCPDALIHRVPFSFDDEGGKSHWRPLRGSASRGGVGVHSVRSQDGYRTELMRGEQNAGVDPSGHPKAVARFGRWPSPFSAAGVASAKVSRSGLQADGTSLFWSESRPEDGGRQVVVKDNDGDAPVEVSPPALSVRSRVHEYGGGAATVSGGVLFFVDQADQRLYRSAMGDVPAPLPLTPEPPAGFSLRYADGILSSSGDWLICVEERHESSGTGHRLVAVATDGSLRLVPLVDAGDFVAAPRPSPDGSHLAWVTWSHPHMSWDGSELWLADLAESDSGIRIAKPHRVAGGDSISVGQPFWCGDGSLVVITDRTGWWLPHRIRAERLHESDAATPLVDLEAEFHAPDWAFGQSTMAELSDGSLICRMHRDGQDHLARLRPPRVGDDNEPSAAVAATEVQDLSDQGGWEVEVVDQPCVTIAGVAVADDGRRVGVLGATRTAGTGVYEVSAGGSRPVRLLTPGPAGAIAPVPAPADIASAEPFVAMSKVGPIPGFFYEPTNTSTTGPEGARPPLVVFCHGGPTGAAEPGFDPVIQFFTSRGIAVAAVNYRGSSGYGRTYRRSLQGLWGIADVDDCTAYAVALADAGRIDAGRMAIRGTSAGGLTALGALVRSERFAGAASWYGVTDLEALALDTHEFESRYLDGLVGPLPAATAAYRQRSPLYHPGEVSGAVLLLQGADDPVVPSAQAERFAEELSAHGVRCTIEVFPGESHGFRRAATIEACLSAELGFYQSLFDPDGTTDPSIGAGIRGGIT